MELHIARSQTTKSKLFGGSEPVYSLRLKADLPETEAQLLKKYQHESYPFDVPDDFPGLIGQKEIRGPLSVSLSDLLRGVEFTSKALHKSFCALPQLFMADYEGLLGRIRAREEWDGEERLSVEYEA